MSWLLCFSEMVTGYENGTTPNPDVLCNKYIKFGAFYNYVVNNMDVDALATGHYAQNSYGNYLQNRHEGNARLLMAEDRWKCQTPFLAQISQQALQNTMFPVGDLLKKSVKEIALASGLHKIVKKKEVGFLWCSGWVPHDIAVRLELIVALCIAHYRQH